MLGPILDRLIGVFSPARGVLRMQARSAMSAMQKLIGGSESGYKAAKVNRLTRRRPNLNENAIPAGDLDNLAGSSWELYRNNKHARKIVRQIVTKVVGTGMDPQPQATDRSGAPFTAFNLRAKKLFAAVSREIDCHGKQGRGGHSFAALSAVALKKIVLSGHVLARCKPVSTDSQISRELILPMVLQLIDPARLDQSIDGYTAAEGKRRVFRGIEFAGDDTRLAYHVLPYHPSDPLGDSRSASTRVPASEILHCFEPEDVDQVTGVPWFAAALDPIRDVGDYEYSELKAAAMGACIALCIKRGSGNGSLGLNAPTGEENTDEDGNPRMRLQPGMIVETGIDGGFESFNPQRPNTNAADFISHLLKTTSGAVPGVKGSTLTGDYRNSSFASERSADNEIWPEIEALQQWFAGCFHQPIYEQVVVEGVRAGWFDQVPGFSAADFAARKLDYLTASWQGPVSRSISPTVDAEAATARKRGLQSSAQDEAAAAGRDLFEIMAQQADAVNGVLALKLPPEIEKQMIASVLGSDPAPPPPVAGQPPAKPTAKKPAGKKAAPGRSIDGNLIPDDEIENLLAEDDCIVEIERAPRNGRRHEFQMEGHSL